MATATLHGARTYRYGGIVFTANEPVPRYWIGGTTVYRVFAPAHSLDRRLRQDYWAAKSNHFRSIFAPVRPVLQNETPRRCR